MPSKERNGDYWAKRLATLEEQQYQRSAAYNQDVSGQFRAAINSVQLDINRWYQRLADNNGINYGAAKRFLNQSELKEFKWNVNQYMKAGRENAIDRRWMKELENASARYHISYLEAMKVQMQQHAELLHTKLSEDMTEFLKHTYSEQYYHTAYELAKRLGIGSKVPQLDTRKINALMTCLWGQDGENFSSRIWTNKEKLVRNLHTELARCIIRGESPQKAIVRLADRMEVSRKQVGRLIMTECAAISSEAQKDCFQELGIEKYQILVILDSNTCDICQDMDGEVLK